MSFIASYFAHFLVNNLLLKFDKYVFSLRDLSVSKTKTLVNRISLQ